MKLRIPARVAEEEDASPKQRSYIRHLCPGLDPEVLASLGMWQASAVIDQLTDGREHRASAPAPPKPSAMRRLVVGLVKALTIAGVGFAVTLYLINRFLD